MRLIDADALIREAERLYGEWNKAMAGAEGTRQINKVYKMQELSKAVAEVARNMTTYVPHLYEMRWIPCTERLPEMQEYDHCGSTLRESDKVLFSAAGRVRTGCCVRFDDNKLHWETKGRFVCEEDVTAWMPLPKAYKED